MTTITLKYPVTVAGDTIDTVTLRRITVGDHVAVARAKGTDTDREVEMMARLTRLTRAAIEAFDEADYNQLGNAVMAMRDGADAGKS